MYVKRCPTADQLIFVWPKHSWHVLGSDAFPGLRWFDWGPKGAERFDCTGTWQSRPARSVIGALRLARRGIAAAANGGEQPAQKGRTTGQQRLLGPQGMRPRGSPKKRRSDGGLPGSGRVRLAPGPEAGEAQLSEIGPRPASPPGLSPGRPLKALARMRELGRPENMAGDG